MCTLFGFCTVCHTCATFIWNSNYTYGGSKKWDIDCGAPHRPMYIPFHWLSISLHFENSFYDHRFCRKIQKHISISLYGLSYYKVDGVLNYVEFFELMTVKMYAKDLDSWNAWSLSFCNKVSCKTNLFYDLYHYIYNNSMSTLKILI